MGVSISERWTGEKFTLDFVGKPEAMGPLESCRCKWMDNINMDVKETACKSVEWINLA